MFFDSNPDKGNKLFHGRMFVALNLVYILIPVWCLVVLLQVSQNPLTYGRSSYSFVNHY